MSNLWERFDDIASAEEVNDAKNTFTPIEAGIYEAVLEELQAGESNSGLPMLKGKFRTTENRILFYNQTLQNINNPKMTAVNIAEAVKFLSDLTGEEVVFEGLGKLGDFAESIPTGKSYYVKVSYGKNDFDMKFPKLKIDKRLDEDGEIPF